MSDSKLRASIASTRATLRTREQSALQSLQAAWAVCKAAILDLVSRFLALMREARKQAGGTLAFFWLIEHGRLSVLKQQLTDAITRYVALVDALARQVANDAAALGNQEAAAQLAALDMPASSVPLAQLPTSLAWLIEKLVSGVASILMLAVSELHPTVEQAIERLINELDWRAETLLRTVLYEAFRGVLIAVFAASGAGWIWRTEEDRRVCPYCQSQDGTRHPAGEPMRTHNNCRCEAEPITLVQHMLSA